MPQPINISASRGAAILKASRWSTPTNIWLQIMESREPGFCEKNNYELPVYEDTAQFRWGKAFESSIIKLAEEKQDNEIMNREEYNDYDKYDFITCHIDGAYRYAKEKDFPLHEGKTTSIFYYRDNFGDPGTDRVPVEYQIQCQHQMICTGAEKVILSVLVFPRRVDEWGEIGINVSNELQSNKSDFDIIKNNPDGTFDDAMWVSRWAEILDWMGYFHQYELTANPELQKLMIQAYSKFWNDHVLTGKPPEIQTYDDIRALIREPVGTIVADEEIERVVSEYRNIKDEIKGTGPLAKRADQIKVDILKWMSDAGTVIDDDTRDRWIMRDRAGKKIAQYSKNKNGTMVFR